MKLLGFPMPENMEAELEKLLRLLAEDRRPFRMHVTYNESISLFLLFLKG